MCKDLKAWGYVWKIASPVVAGNAEDERRVIRAKAKQKV